MQLKYIKSGQQSTSFVTYNVIKMMPLTAFISTFAPSSFIREKSSFNSHVRCVSQSTCMTLLSHEKLDVVFSTPDGDVAKYRLDMEIPASFSKKKRRESIQTMKKHADFRGFRKGTIPPFIMKDMDGFVFRDSVEDIISEAVQELNLLRSEGEDSEADYDIETLQKEFKCGKDFQFSCEVVLTSMSKNDNDVHDMEDVITVDTEDVGPSVDLQELQSQTAEANKPIEE